MIEEQNEITILTAEDIKSQIYTIRGVQVMLDRDLAKLYGLETKYLKRQVKRNIDRFPNDFMFELTKEDINSLRCQIGTLDNKGRGEHSKYLSFAFTENGVSMLASVLNSKKAVQISIRIIRAFITMRKFLISNAQIFQRLDNVERNLLEYKIDTDKKIDEVFQALESDIKPKQGIFYEGQVFDAYKFVSDIIRRAQKSVIIIDNFVDDRVLVLLNKRNKNVSATIYTKNITKEFLLDLKKHNLQYSKIEIKEFKNCHDRFIIIDEKEVYHLGASVKDLGTRWVGFSRIDKESVNILEKLLFL